MPRNILITGLPHSGKTTLLKNLVAKISNKIGFVTNDILVDGKRVGFEIETHTGKKSILAHIDFNTSYQVSRYFVAPENLHEPIQEISALNESSILYLDEIGQMELLSPEFVELTQRYLDSPNMCVATLSAVYKDPFIERIKERPDVQLVEITPENRDMQSTVVKEMLSKGFQ